MFKNLVLCLVLLFSFNSFALTNEEKARKLYVETNLDLHKNCSDYYTPHDTSISTFHKIKGNYNLNILDDLFEYQKILEELLFCFNFVKNNYLPSINEIKSKYPTTQVAYDLINEKTIWDIGIFIDEICEDLEKENKVIKIKIEQVEAKIQAEIEKKQAEIEKENNKIINCYKANGNKYKRKKLQGCEKGDTTYNPVGLTISEMDILRQQLRSCWVAPAGAVIERGMFVKISAQYNEDAKMKENSIKVVETNISLYNPFYDAIINSAKRTFYNPECETLKLPLDKYDSWKNITINFDFEFMKK